MSTAPPFSAVFAGFRATGKTTFLVALWHTVINNDVPGALSLEKIYEGDRDYITKRHNEWLAYDPVKRTQVDYDTPIQMTLREARSERLFQLGIPDLSGETFKVQFEERRASSMLVGAVRAATGVALFINPKEVADPTMIRDVWDVADALEGEQASVESHAQDASSSTSATGTGEATVEQPKSIEQGQPNEGKKNPADEFAASKCCTQVKYVDLLQQLADHGPARPLRCAVIVSAMDTLDGTEFEDRPQRFLEARMSMLNQYLLANRSLFDARTYGVSAQGGEYDTATIEALAKLGPKRIRVCGDGSRDSDISRPLRWLAFGD